jgi:hypothetical protein
MATETYSESAFGAPPIFGVLRQDATTAFPGKFQDITWSGYEVPRSVTFLFSSALTSEEKEVLDEIVANHTGEQPPIG